jgi:prepilin-type N-terminal cleavage/methylation domain-containing protein
VTRARVREDGFTLIELLVAMSIGVIVLLGAFSLVDRAFPASKRVTDRVDASQRGRVAMENMLRELRSSVCVQTGTDANQNPVFTSPYASADGNSVTFFSDLTTAAAATSGTFLPTKRQLTYSSGAITESITQGTGTIPSITWDPATTTTKTLISDITPIGTTPVFSYWAYDATKTLVQLAPGGGAVAAVDVPRIDRVDIAFRALPTGGSNPTSGIDMQDSANTRVSTDFTLNASGQSNAQRGPVCAF